MNIVVTHLNSRLISNITDKIDNKHTKAHHLWNIIQLINTEILELFNQKLIGKEHYTKFIVRDRINI